MDSSPLDCHVCNKELSSPRILPCLHSVCSSCSPCCSSSTSNSSSCCPDRLAEFLIETSHETAEMCANCDQIRQPMYYCETCQQALCYECRNATHKARMFSAHRLVVAEESARVRGRVTCPHHSEPYILYCTEQRSLACIQCFNERPPEDSIYQLCQQIHDTVLATRDRLVEDLEQTQREAERACREQIQEIVSIMGPIRLCLLSAQILCSTASPLDALQLSSELHKRVQTITSRSVDKLPSVHSMDPIEARTEIAKALEPFLGNKFLYYASLSIDISY
ncbi:unnamed protein product [Heligmosomoides polygyrus]|uniref:B box-type domain-containing protein n=1 Tax=Heligmosomoides polygyrus TaxID=6339 RepID=A0A183GH32_HELPZ|nr:unnamed protein product [Heligmosomoides polygyrus]